MTIRDFIAELNKKCLDGITYNIYISDLYDQEIDLQKQKDEILGNQIHNVLYNIIQAIILDLLSRRNISLDDELRIDLPDFLESVMVVKYSFQELLEKSEQKCVDEDTHQAVVKVRMINDDIFNKIPLIAGEIFHGPK
jgi:hypothetical protein